MPPRFVYWTIVIDGAMTAFRAATRDELLPTLKQLQRRTPGAVMKWFARGRVWESPEEAEHAFRVESARRRAPRASPRHGPRSGGQRAGGPRSSGPRSSGPRSSGPQSSRPPSSGPRSSGPRSGGPARVGRDGRRPPPRGPRKPR